MGSVVLDSPEMPEVVVALTTYPPRIGFVAQTIRSLLQQTVRPGHVVLTLSKLEFPNGVDDLSSDLRGLCDGAVELIWDEGNLKSHKKYFHAMRKYPDAVVITVDDDKQYPPTLVAELLESYRRHPDCVSAMRTHLMTFDQQGKVRPYLEWVGSCNAFAGRPNLALMAIGAGGILYPPHRLPPRLFDVDAIQATCADADDIWLKFMSVVAGMPVVLANSSGDRATTIEGSQQVALYRENMLNGRNDQALGDVERHVQLVEGVSVLETIYHGQATPTESEWRLAMSNVGEMQRKFNATVAKRDAMCRELKDRTARLESEKQAMAGKLSAAEASRAGLEAQVSEMTAGKRSLEAQVAELSERGRQLEARAAELAANDRKRETLLAKLKSDVRALSVRLTAQTARANRAVSDYFKMKQWFEKADRDYAKLSKAKLGRLTLRYWRLKDAVKNRVRKLVAPASERKPQLPGVTVIIPTYKPSPWLQAAVDSLGKQEYRPRGIRILICVNGDDAAYRRQLVKAYSANKMVKVLYTRNQGLNCGRNLGIKNVKTELFTFLDDDDWMTPGYLKGMCEPFLDEQVNLSIGRTEDYDEVQGTFNGDTYLNKALEKVGAGLRDDYDQFGGLLSNMCGKVYRTAFFREAIYPLDEVEKRSEDVIFWAENLAKLKGRAWIADSAGKEAYIRRLTANSLSRPGSKAAFDFWVTGGLRICDRLGRMLVDPAVGMPHKRFVLGKLVSQVQSIKKYVDGLSGEDRERALSAVDSTQNLFFNKSLFASRKAIAFCHNFPPFVDASSMVASKRLRQICKLEGGSLDWRVIAQNMHEIRTSDPDYLQFYVNVTTTERQYVNKPFTFGPRGQQAYAEEACRLAEAIDASVIYSRSMFVGSHMAASRYKKAHPGVKWYAEFSDPLAYGVDAKERPCNGTPTWFDVEQMVYEGADRIIFTNGNQMEYMLSYNPRPELNDSIRARALVMHHPVLPSEYCGVHACDYQLDPSKINIGFFGTFYVTRKADDMLKLLDNPQVVLHVFTTKPQDLQPLVDRYQGRLAANEAVSHLEFLNLGAKMDYLFLNDTEFPGKINPFLPSKYADYRVTGTPIIAKVVEGSVLSKMEDPLLLAVPELSGELLQSLRKRSKE